MSSFLHNVTQFLAVVSVFVLQDLFFWTDLEPPHLFLTPARTKLFFEFFIPHIKYVLEGKVANSPIATIVLPPPPSIGALIAHGSVNCHQHCLLGNLYVLGIDLDIYTEDPSKFWHCGRLGFWKVILTGRHFHLAARVLLLSIGAQPPQIEYITNIMDHPLPSLPFHLHHLYVELLANRTWLRSTKEEQKRAFVFDLVNIKPDGKPIEVVEVLARPDPGWVSWSHWEYWSSLLLSLLFLIHPSIPLPTSTLNPSHPFHHTTLSMMLFRTSPEIVYSRYFR